MYGQCSNGAFILSLLQYKPEEGFSFFFLTAERELYESIPWGETMAKDEAALVQALYRTTSTAKQPQVRHCGLVFRCEMCLSPLHIAVAVSRQKNASAAFVGRPRKQHQGQLLF
jgi:hypothetical protein